MRDIQSRPALLTGTEQTPACDSFRATKHRRGGVVSERHVHPCGKRPRPTGQDNHRGCQNSDAVGQQTVGPSSDKSFAGRIKPPVQASAASGGDIV